ncbi:hypothetical protein M5689_017684 [Euphorbia peplus]|nr:hypothetical protein M5689_017684 [Euphorbia peplus]
MHLCKGLKLDEPTYLVTFKEKDGRLIQDFSNFLSTALKSLLTSCHHNRPRAFHQRGEVDYKIELVSRLTLPIFCAISNDTSEIRGIAETVE